MAITRKVLLTILVGLFCSVQLGAQATGIVSGQVLDATNQQDAPNGL
jgi:hypothetical protein